MCLVQCGAGEYVYQAGQQPSGVYWLEQGRVEVRVPPLYRVARIVTAPALLGTEHAVAEVCRYSVRALDHGTRLRLLTVPVFQQLCQQYPMLRLYVVRQLSREATPSTTRYE